MPDPLSEAEIAALRAKMADPGEPGLRADVLRLLATLDATRPSGDEALDRLRAMTWNNPDVAEGVRFAVEYLSARPSGYEALPSDDHDCRCEGQPWCVPHLARHVRGDEIRDCLDHDHVEGAVTLPARPSGDEALRPWSNDDCCPGAKVTVHAPDCLATLDVIRLSGPMCPDEPPTPETRHLYCAPCLSYFDEQRTRPSGAEALRAALAETLRRLHLWDHEDCGSPLDQCPDPWFRRMAALAALASGEAS